MKRTILLPALVALTLTGCTFLTGPYPGEQRSGRSTSLVDYLYPGGEVPPEVAERVPSLSLPLRVGLAVVPESHRASAGLGETGKTALLESVASAFRDLDYVEHIEIIPTAYLRAGQGSGGMQQVARLFDVDVMALVSYDQVARTFENKRSLLYWTIVGAYVIEGTDHDTRTFLDLAVVDVRTTKLLLRAPGFNERRGDTTLVDAHRALQANSARGFEDAVSMLNQNLALELVEFEERLKSDPEDIQVSWRGGGGAGGVVAMGMLWVMVVRRRFAGSDAW